MKIRCCIAVVAVVAGTVSLPAAALGDVVPISSHPVGSTEGLGAFSGSMSYTPLSATTGELTVSLTNESPAANGGWITGFVFRINSADAAATAVLTSASHPFVNVGMASAPPFGEFDAGAALGGSWVGGGSPSAGIAVGQTGTFTFTVTAADAPELNAASFVTAGEPYGLVARMRGFADGGSDKVPGVIVLVPGPAGATALIAGGALAARRRRG